MSRFNYVAYDEISQKQQAELKSVFESAEAEVEAALSAGRAKALVMTHLEEAYMWCGKAIRDEQLAQRGAKPQEERKNS